jgi:hypothetical protein
MLKISGHFIGFLVDFQKYENVAQSFFPKKIRLCAMQHIAESTLHNATNGAELELLEIYLNLRYAA